MQTFSWVAGILSEMKPVGGVEHLIKEEMYQVFLMTCPANMPFSFATHPWFVIHRKGVISRHGVHREKDGTRWEVLFETGQNHESWGHLHKNLLPPFQGIAVFPFSHRFFWKGRLCDFIEGGSGSVADRMSAFIADSPHEYPYSERYSLLGPNSNTYVEWTLNQFPDSGLRLPWNAIGKNYRG